MDKNYWKNIYSKQSEGEQPSQFAKYIAETIIIEEKSIIELGCGNGRDAIFFANANAQVTALDQCDNIIELLNHRYVVPYRGIFNGQNVRIFIPHCENTGR